MAFKAPNQTFPVCAVCAVGPDGKIKKIDPTMVSNDPPYFDGVTIAAPDPTLDVQVVTVYGAQVQIQGKNWTVGGLLYAGVDGLLTQDFQSLLTGAHWVIPIGRAVARDKFLYEPHIPTSVMFAPE